MFGIRTPAKVAGSQKSPTKTVAVPSTAVVRSIEQWEAANRSPIPSTSSSTTEPTLQAGPAKTKGRPALTQEGKTAAITRKSVEVLVSPPKTIKYADRTAEAKACLTKTNLHLGNSRNTKTEIKTAITEATDRLYQLVKEAETELKSAKIRLTKTSVATGIVEIASDDVAKTPPLPENDAISIITKIEEHSKLLAENGRKMQELKEAMEQQQQTWERGNTYASVAASRGAGPPLRSGTLHSVVVTSKNGADSSDEVLGRVRETMNAKDGWIKVEKVRKARDKKVIIGLGSKEERTKVKECLQKEGANLTVEEIRNKDPLLILKNVLVFNTDEDVLKALRNQNRSVFDGLNGEENRLEIKYRRRTRNPHTGHIIISVSPTIWRRALEIGALHIDLQRIRVEDQTPLVQCTRCLGFGHGRRFCKEPADLCGHCGGPHLRSECADWLADVPPKCVNCVRGKLEHTDHNAFSYDCQTRNKWDELARSTVAYC